MERLNMLSHEEVKEVEEWLAAYDKNHLIWEEGGINDTTIYGFLDEYGRCIDSKLLDYDTYKGWFNFKYIYKILDRTFAYECFEDKCGIEVIDFYEVDKKEYYKRVKVVDWVRKD